MKKMYIKAVRALKRVFEFLGILTLIEKFHERSRLSNWLLSLFYIYDLDGLVKLDVPWWTYDAIENVERFLSDRPNSRVFEYGSGASTIWLSKRAAHVRSVEHDENWFTLMAEKTSTISSIDLVHEPPTTKDESSNTPSGKEGYFEKDFLSYVNSINRYAEKYDLIVIDGRARTACLQHAKERLSPNGVIVFDNAKRRRYRDAIENAGLRIEDYSGLTPALPYRESTFILRAES